MRSGRTARRFRWVRRMARPSLYVGPARPSARRWLRGWRILLMTFLAAGGLTVLALLLERASGPYFDFGYQVAARLAGAASLAVPLVALNVLVEWLGHLSVKVQRYRDRVLRELSRALPSDP